MVKQCSVIFGCLAVGEFISWILNIPVPGSILGMLLLTFLLDEKVINVNSVKGISQFLVFIATGHVHQLLIRRRLNDAEQ